MKRYIKSSNDAATSNDMTQVIKELQTYKDTVLEEAANQAIADLKKGQVKVTIDDVNKYTQIFEDTENACAELADKTGLLPRVMYGGVGNENRYLLYINIANAAGTAVEPKGDNAVRYCLNKYDELLRTAYKQKRQQDPSITIKSALDAISDTGYGITVNDEETYLQYAGDVLKRVRNR